MTVLPMKIILTLLSIILLLAGLPLLQGLLIFWGIEEFLLVPSAMSFFYLFAIPAWTLSILVFVVETYRRSFIPSEYRISNTMMLGLMGMIAPTTGLALSPVGADIGLPAYAGVAALGLIVGLLGAVLFNFMISTIKKMTCINKGTFRDE